MPNYEVPAPAAFLPRPGKPTKPWSKWRDNFVDVFLVAAAGEGPPFSAKLAKALLLSHLGEEGQRVYDTLPPTPKLEGEDEFQFCLRQLDSHFTERVNVIVERFTFRQRPQLSTESTAEYVSVLRGLAKTCSFGSMEDELIRDVVVEKTIHSKLRDRFLQDSELTLDKVLTISEAYERSVRESNLMSSHDHITVSKVFPRSQPTSHRSQSHPTQSHPSQCTNCGHDDHAAYSSQCPARRATCRACGKRGHYAALCQSCQTEPSLQAEELLRVAVQRREASDVSRHHIREAVSGR